MMRVVTVLLTGLTVAAQPGGVDLDRELAGPGEPWSSERIAARAVSVSPDVSAADAGRRAAEAGAEEAWAATLPRTVLRARYTRLADIDNAPLVDLDLDVDAARAAASQVTDPAARGLWSAQIDQLEALGSTSIDIPRNQYALAARAEYPVSALFLEILPAIRARTADADRSRVGADVARSEVALGAVELYLEHARARGAAAVARQSVVEARQNLADARARLDTGTGNRPDVLRFEARVYQARGEVAEREADVVTTADALRTRLDLPGSGPLAFSERITQITDAPYPGASVESLVDRAYRVRDELVAARSLVDANEATGRAERGAQWPGLVVAGALDYAQPNRLFTPPNEDFEVSWSVSAILEWSPDAAWAASRRSRRARAETSRATAGVERIRDAVRIEVTRAAARYRAAEVGFEAATRGLAAAEEALAARRRGYELGVFDATDLVDAELDASRARLAVVDAGVDLRIRRARLRRAVGARLWEQTSATEQGE